MLIAWIAFGVSVIIITIVLARRFPAAAMLDVDSIAAERQKKIKEQLALTRFKRGAEVIGDRFKKTFSPIQKVVTSSARSVYDKVLSLEKTYQEERRTVARPLKEEEKGAVTELLSQAEKLLDEARYGESEAVFIKVISVDPRSIRSYKGLAKIYFETKQLDQSKETLDFLLKLKPGDAESFAMRSEVAYARADLHAAEEEMVKARNANLENISYTVDLAQILFEEKKFCEAAGIMREALARDMNNPKYLDFLVEASILCPDAQGADSALERLKAVNPENAKLKEFESRVKAMTK
ncbi:MAG: tetratricopeptide repeat protein [bacterium]